MTGLEEIEELLDNLFDVVWDLSEEEVEKLKETRPALCAYLTEVEILDEGEKVEPDISHGFCVDKLDFDDEQLDGVEDEE